MAFLKVKTLTKTIEICITNTNIRSDYYGNSMTNLGAPNILHDIAATVLRLDCVNHIVVWRLGKVLFQHTYVCILHIGNEVCLTV